MERKLSFPRLCSGGAVRQANVSKNAEALFLSKGFQNLKDATRIFRAHGVSKCHREAVQKVVLLPLTTPNVGELLSSKLAEERKQNREMLLHILRSVQLLARQGLVFRGELATAETWTSDAMDSRVRASEPDSNLHQLLTSVSAFDDHMSAWLRKKTNKYISSDSAVKCWKPSHFLSFVILLLPCEEESLP